MYCHACGQRVPAGAAFCSSCGASQQHIARRRNTIHPALLVLCLLLFPPAGIILIFAATDWPSNVKWGVAGIFFPPLWIRLLWAVDWLPYVAGALLALLTLDRALFGHLSAGGATAILLVIAVVLLVTFGVQRSRRKVPKADHAPFRRAIEEKLDLSNEIIAQIEADRALDLVPARLPIHERYMEALNLRSQAQDRFERAEAPVELARANAELEGALHSLRQVRSELGGDHRSARPGEPLY